MPSLYESLTLRFQAVLQSTSDSYFYQNLHHYFDLVEKTPALKALVDDSQHEYAHKHSALWRRGYKLSDKEADDAEEKTIRLERFNLYAIGTTIYVRIYIPLEDYIHSINDSEIDLHPSAVLMMRGIHRINPKYAKISPFKWGKDKIRSLNKWFEGKRAMYEGEFRQFHLFLVAALEAAQVKKPAASIEPPLPEIPLMFNPRTGDFLLHTVAGNFSPASKEFAVLRYLLDSPDYQATFLELIQAAYPHIQEATKPNKTLLYKIIDGIKKKLGEDVIENVQKLGYRLVFKPNEPEVKQG